MQTNTLLRVDGSREILPTGELTLDQMYAAIGCDTVELIRLSENSEIWCDENGLYAAKVITNQEATALYKAAYPKDTLMFPEDWDGLRVVGNAILSENVNRKEE